MDEKIYSITLADGSVLENLRLNGNNFISASEITEEMFLGNCSSVTISDGETEETYKNMALVGIDKVGEEYWFILRRVSEAELVNARVRADIDYLAMMADIALEEE